MEPAYLELLRSIFEVCIIPLLGLLTSFLVAFLKAKKEEALTKAAANKTLEEQERLSKYLNMVEETVIECIMATNQTYVDSLKSEGKFDAEAQKKAFEKTFKSVSTILASDAKEYLTQIFGDLNLYLTNLIESQIKMSKTVN